MSADAGRAFDVPAETVVSGSPCTWCGSSVGGECLERGRVFATPHAQRWRDYWNATQDRRERVEVYAAPWREDLP